jgi:multidrug resistance efflux pump
MSVNESNRRLHILLTQQSIYKKEIGFKKKDLERNKDLYKKGVISLKTMEEKELDFLREKRAFQNLKSSISNLREGIGNSHKSLKGNEIKKIQEENKMLKQVIQSYNQLKRAIKDWELQFVLNSSINGKITFLSVFNQTQRVNQNDLVFTVIPTKNSSFIGKIKAPARNSGKLKIGQQVNIRLANYPSEEFGMLNGVIKNISLITDQQGNYLIDVSLPQNLMTTYKKELVFKQEMQGSAEIITEDLRLIERFFYQIRAVFDE